MVGGVFFFFPRLQSIWDCEAGGPGARTIHHLVDRKGDLLLVLALLSTGCSCGLLGGLLLLLLIFVSAHLMSIAHSLLSEDRISLTKSSQWVARGS